MTRIRIQPIQKPASASTKPPPSPTSSWSASSTRSEAGSSATFAATASWSPTTPRTCSAWDHGGGFSLDASVRIEATDRAGLERLIRYCARPPFALDRLHLVDDRSDQILYLLPGPDLAGRTALRLSALEFLDRLAKILPPPRIHRHRYHGVFAPNAPLRPLVTARAQEDNALAAQALRSRCSPSQKPPRPRLPSQRRPNRQTPDTTPSRPSRWAALLARIYEVFPLICPTCQTPLTFIAFLTDPEPITQILAHIGEPTSPPLLHPARGPPQTELGMGPDGGETDEVAQESFPDDLDQSPAFDPAEPEPIPEDDFDQSWERLTSRGPPAPPEVRPEFPKTPLPYPKPHPTYRS